MKISFFLLGIITLTGCTSIETSNLRVGGNETTCLIWLGEHWVIADNKAWKQVADDALAHRKGVAVVERTHDAPWRCVAGTIYNLQKEEVFQEIKIKEDGRRRRIEPGR